MILAVSECCESSTQFLAECDAVTDGHLGDLQTPISCDEFVELYNEGPGLIEELGQCRYWLFVRVLRHSPPPQRVIVVDRSSHSH